MATDLSDLVVRIQLQLNANVKKAADLAAPAIPLVIGKTQDFAFAATPGANEANQIWWDRRTVAGNGADPLDLNGTLKNIYNESLDLTAVKAIIVLNQSDLTTTTPAHTATDAHMAIGDIAAGGTEFQGPMNDPGDGLILHVGGMFAITNPTATGWVVGAAASDILYIKNLDAADELLYDVIFVGEQ